MRVRMIEAFKGRIKHSFSDGIYIHSGDLFDSLEADLNDYEEATDFTSQEVIESLITRLQLMILNREGGSK